MAKIESILRTGQTQTKQMLEYASSFSSGVLSGLSIVLAAIVLFWAIDVSRIRSYKAPVSAPGPLAPSAEEEAA